MLQLVYHRRNIGGWRDGSVIKTTVALSGDSGAVSSTPSQFITPDLRDATSSLVSESASCMWCTDVHAIKILIEINKHINKASKIL